MLIGLVVILLLTVLLVRAGSVPSGGYLERHPRHTGWLRDLGLNSVEDFLALQGLIVGGHPDRNVARLELGGQTVYLKREHRVPWSVRLASWWAGLGWCSRSLREGRVLQALEREGFPSPNWLAAGETSDGRAFLLLLGVPDARELRALLPTSTAPERRRLLVQLARGLARLHTCGLVHPDLYASHVLVAGEQLVFLDWARCQRRAVVSIHQRARALAALDTTLPTDEATSFERLLALRAYLRAAGPDLAPEDYAPLLRLLDRYRRQLARRRHVVEKSQPRLDPGLQNWTWIEGEELCIASTLGEVFPGRDPGWLSLRQETPAATRWTSAPGGETVRLERHRHDGLHVRRMVAWLRGRVYTAPEQRRAHLLLRLERYRIVVPRVLAMGQRWRGPGQLEAFLLTRPPTRTLGLGIWLERSPRIPERARVLRATGELVRRLHAAGCYLESTSAWSDVSVRLVGSDPDVVLQGVEGLTVRRGFEPRRAAADLQRCRTLLATFGCTEFECAVFASGYHETGPALTTPEMAIPGGDPTMSEPAPLRSGQAPPRASFWQRLRRGVRRLWQRAGWSSFIGDDWPETIMNLPVTDRFHAKQGRSTGRLIVPAQEGAPEGAPESQPLRVYLKRHYELPWWDRLMALLWPGGGWSPALQELHHLEKARRLGVPVPEVVAAGEFIGPGLRLQSFLAVRELTGMLPLHEAIPLASQRMDPETFARWKQSLIQEMARLTRLLHDRHWFHKDLYLCHFYIDEAHTFNAPAEGWRDRVVMIDLHRLGHHPWTWAVWQMKDLAQLLYSSEVEGVTDRDRLAFWRAYQGPGPRRWWEGWLRWFVVLKWRRYRAHNLRHAARRTSAPSPGQPVANPVTTEDRT